MIKKLLRSKKIITSIVLVILLIVAIVVGVIMIRDSREKEKLEAGHGVEDNVSEDDEVYDGNGLEIQEEIDETIDSVDASGTWDETTQSDDSQQDDKKENTDTNDDTPEDDEQEEKPEEDVLVDDKEWGEIS